MPIDWTTIEPLLMRVEKPARYVGGEFNQVVKPDARVRACLAFPDVYEIGMSYHGYRLLYERVNAREGWAAERAYAPWPDFEALLRAHRVPLYALETRRPLAEFDWVGFTLQHELNFANVLNMIDLAGLPVESAARGPGHPILIGGGEGAFSPEPLAPFLDAFVVGDAEETIVDLMETFDRAKQEGWAGDRDRLLATLAALPGVYVPRFYAVEYHPDGRIARIGPAALPTPSPEIRKRHYDIAADPGSIRPVVPLMRTIHDRLVVEIRRGCVNGCRFCHAGMTNRPVAERPVAQIVDAVRRGLDATGYDEISLLSLSTADYTQLRPLVARLRQEFGPRGVSISLPSIRINGFDVALVDELAGVRRAGFTFAPEAGTERLRRVINKPVDQEAFFAIVDDVFRRGWRTLKFYFMIGLPTETEEDLDGIAEICARAGELGRRRHGRKAAIHVTLSPFVPKAATPFQWEPQLPRAELERRYQYVREAIRHRAGRQVEVKMHDVDMSFLEAILARGDRRLGAIIKRAWELGARLDGWAEHFDLDRWLRAFQESGLDPAFYANRRRDREEIFPYDHIRAGVGRLFLERESDRAARGEQTDACDDGPCAGCDACDGPVQHTLAEDAPPDVAEEAKPGEPSVPRPPDPCPVAIARGGPIHAARPPVQRLRLIFSRLGGLKFLSHLDFAKVLFMIFRRADVPLAQSQGFNPQPRVQFAPPLPLGMDGERERVDLLLTARRPLKDLLRDLNRIPLDGLAFQSAEEIPLTAPSLEQSIAASRYRAEPMTPPADWTRPALADRIDRFLACPDVIVESPHKSGPRPVDLRRSVLSLAIDPDTESSLDSPPRVLIEITHEPGLYVKPQIALGAILGRPLELGRDVRVTRLEMIMKN